MRIEKKSEDIYMEMYNEALADNAAMIRGTNVPIEPPSLEQNPNVHHIRRLLLVFVGIDLVSEKNLQIFNTKQFTYLGSLLNQFPFCHPFIRG